MTHPRVARDVPTTHLVTTEDELRALYPTPVDRTWKKESPVVTPGHAELIGGLAVLPAGHRRSGRDRLLAPG